MARVKKWSQAVTETSDAMDVKAGTFKSGNPKAIAEAVEHDAERSTRRKSTPYRSAMSALNFYINRAGKNLSAEHRDVLERAKEILRAEYGGDDEGGTRKKTPSGRRKTTVKAGTRKAATPRPATTAKRSAAKRPSAKRPAAKRTAAKSGRRTT